MSMDDLNRQFALPSLLGFENGRGGLPCARITHPDATGEIYLHGGHVTAWQPAGQRPVLWMSQHAHFQPDRAIRGGVPICFPWFGPKANDPAAPSHGTARLSAWTVAETSHDERGVTLRLTASFQPAFDVSYSVTVGPTLEMALAVTNAAAEASTFEAALHTYLAVSDVRQVRVTGLEHVAWLDSLAGRKRIPGMAEPLTFTAETDRIYLDDGPAVTIEDPAWGRSIRIAKRHSRSTVVWNPWIDKAARMSDFADDEWPEMLCVETANIGDRGVTLAPGGRHEMVASLSVTASGV